jgi:hypothetical protein
MIDEKMSTNSRASAINASRSPTLPFPDPVSINLRNNRHSFASFRQIFTRIRKSFLLSASSASIQFAATEPDARTSCRTSSALLTVLGNGLTNARTDSANRNVRSSRSRRFAPSSIFAFWNFTWDLGFGICDLRSQRQRPFFAPHQRDRPLRSARRHFLSTTAFPSQRLSPRDERSTAQIA